MEVNIKVQHLSTEECYTNVIVEIKLYPGKIYRYITSKFIEDRFLKLCKITKNSMKAFNYLKKNSTLL